MRRVLIATAFLVAAFAPAAGESLAGKWTKIALAPIAPGHGSVATLYRGQEGVVSQYAMAMRRYKAAAEQGESERLAIPFLPRDQGSQLQPFTWVAANGDTVRRTGDGVFALAAGNQLGTWSREVSCQIVDWPTLACGDGRDRVMSAPDLMTMIFDGVEYRRPYPTSQLPEDALPQE